MIIVDEKTFNFLMSQTVEPEQEMLNDKYDCKDAIDDDGDRDYMTQKRYHGQKKTRENSWVRNHHHKVTFCVSSIRVLILMILHALRVLCATIWCMIWTSPRSFSALTGSIIAASSLALSIKRKRNIVLHEF